MGITVRGLQTLQPGQWLSEPGDWQTWLAGTAAEAVDFLDPQEVPLQVYQVGLAVGNPRNQGEQLVAPLNPA